jgi:hypothetical protein
MSRVLVVGCLVAPLLCGAVARAQEVSAVAAAPSPPIITRDDRRSATVRAVHLSVPLRLDGRLDEAVYRETPAISDFLQTLPKENAGEPHPLQPAVSREA